VHISAESSVENLDEMTAEELWQADIDHVVHPLSVWPVIKEKGCTIMERGAGVYIYDVHGNRYLDSSAGLWSVHIGYGRKEMAKAAMQQLEKLPQINQFGDSASIPAIQLAKKLSEFTPVGLDHVFFSNSGSDANESAIRIAHNYFRLQGKDNKKLIISRAGSYHGSTIVTSSISGKFADPALPHRPKLHYLDDLVSFVSSPDVYRMPAHLQNENFCDHLIDELEKRIIELGPDNIACFISEPVMGLGGVLVPPPGYCEQAAEVCRKHDILFIHDEVITAFGRLGYMFSSSERFDVVPDIITCAKGITSGYQPLAATILSDHVYDVISAAEATEPFAHGFTYSGHPVCCAVALKNIEILERDKICDLVLDQSSYFEKRMAELKDEKLVGDVRGTCSIFCIEHVADKKTKAGFAPELGIGARLAAETLKRGVYVRAAGNLLFISPPLIISKDEIDMLVSVLKEAERSVARQLS